MGVIRRTVVRIGKTKSRQSYVRLCPAAPVSTPSGSREDAPHGFARKPRRAAGLAVRLLWGSAARTRARRERSSEHHPSYLHRSGPPLDRARAPRRQSEQGAHRRSNGNERTDALPPTGCGRDELRGGPERPAKRARRSVPRGSNRVDERGGQPPRIFECQRVRAGLPPLDGAFADRLRTEGRDRSCSERSHVRAGAGVQAGRPFRVPGWRSAANRLTRPA